MNLRLKKYFTNIWKETDILPHRQIKNLAGEFGAYFAYALKIHCPVSFFVGHRNFNFAMNNNPSWVDEI